ncbi:MAG: TRAP transporter small permease subunit, partial [Alphaproteobacteria bacterium]|nr:TRAP transporter small permease subunit [Alphaproteobacteria bacterium]
MRAKAVLERLLEYVVILLMAAMFVIVVLGVTYRKMGEALVWYDEIAEISLAWLTYYGAALAALKRGHIGMATLVERGPIAWRKAAFIAAETVVFA